MITIGGRAHTNEEIKKVGRLGSPFAEINLDDLHLPLGDGIVDYPKILSILGEKGYPSTITMEVKPEDMPLTQKEVEAYINTGATT
jgi:sugar phosphate isomerase/epimerase